MRTSERWFAGLIVLVVGVVLGLFLGGPQVPGCLGPIGVTAVECMAMTGIAPTVWLGPTIPVLAVFMAAIIVKPVPKRRWLDCAIAAIVGSIIGAAVHLGTRQLIAEGATSSGAYVRVVLPVDGFALLAATLAGATILVVTVCWRPDLAPWHRVRSA